MLKHHYADVNNIRLHYVTSGETKNRKLILFVHGFPEFWYEWENQLLEFGKDYFAVAPDLRGFNLSSKPAEVKQYRAQNIVEDLRQLAAQLGYEKFILVAHDWGGAAAWQMAIAHPQLIEKLIIINSPHPMMFLRELVHNAAQQTASAYMNFFRTDKAEATLQENNYARLCGMMTKWGNNAWFTDALKTKYIEAWSQPGALTGGLNYYRATPMYPPTETDPGPKALHLDPAQFHVRVPTLVIWGEQDVALLATNLDGLEQYVSDLTIKRIPDGSHWVIHEHPDLVNQTMREFINK
ncbi:MAG: alpha/beta hydrolase [Burkholderiales bacterium]